MSTWKRVLTTDDLGDVENTDLAISDLSQSPAGITRNYTLSSDVSETCALQFVGEAVVGSHPLLQMKQDAGTHTLNLSALHGVYIGDNVYGQWRLPGQASCAAKTFLVGTSTTSSTFDSFEDLMGQGGSSLSHSNTGDFISYDANTGTISDTLDASPIVDSVLVFDASDGSNGKFAHTLIRNIPTRVTYHFGRNEQKGNGTYYLKGVNGVEHDGQVGFVATRKLYLVGLSLGFFKVSSSSQDKHRRRLQVYKNGSQVYASGYTTINAGTNNTFVTLAEHEKVDSDLSGAVSFDPGDVISVAVFNPSSSSYSGVGRQFQATLEFI